MTLLKHAARLVRRSRENCLVALMLIDNAVYVDPHLTGPPETPVRCGST